MDLQEKNILEKVYDFLTGLPAPVVGGLKVLGILLLAFAVIKIGKYFIRSFLSKKWIFKHNIDEKKLKTVSSLMVSVFKYGVYIIAGVAILTDVFNMTSVLAAAGVGGLAIGFGAQSLIKDVISGFFLVMEDQYAVGDMVTIEGMTGTVEAMELRITKLRNFNGDLYLIPNGEIKKVINHSRGNRAAIVDIPVSHHEDTEKAFEIVQKACEQAAAEYDPGTIVEPPKVLGITEMGNYAVVIRVVAKTVFGAQWELERKIRKYVKEGFNREGIEFFVRDRLVFSKEESGGGQIHG